jgi:hypothetical protein
MSVAQNTTGKSTSFITFSNSTGFSGVVAVFTTSNTQAGVKYTVSIKGTINAV